MFTKEPEVYITTIDVYCQSKKQNMNGKCLNFD